MSCRSLRCVAMAYQSLKGETVPTNEELTNWELLEGDLVLLAIVGLKDPCRPGVPEAVQLNCVRMVTGDNLQTAKAIALECGILGSNADTTAPNVIEGKSFSALLDETKSRGS
ncbi:putative P-type Ca(2+) transporter [Helianthus annuus]|nr:putative P-type Ca(2+) transporter [Helianthus annuus]